MCDQIKKNHISLYQIEIEIKRNLITVMKFQAQIMFLLDVMNKKVDNFHKSVVITCKVIMLFYRTVSVLHIVVVSMKTTAATSLKLWKTTVCMMGLNAQQTAQHEKF